MDFFTNHDAPLSVNIDGTAYLLPRFLNPALKAWGAKLKQEHEDHAVEGLEREEDKARIKMYYAPLFSISDVLARVSTPEGAEYIVDAQMKLAKVPDDIRAKMLQFANPRDLETLALQLTRTPEAQARLGVTPAETSDPLQQSTGASGEQPVTGAQTPPDSTPSTT